MASAVARAYNGGLGQNPQRGPGANPLVRDQGAKPPSEAETLLIFGQSTEAANLHTFLKFENKKQSDICVTFAKKS